MTPITSQEPEPTTPPHKYPWENFVVDCEVGKLVCSFVPGGSHPEGFTGPFQDRFAEYLGLTASVTYHVERQNQEEGTGWVLRYRLREGDQWNDVTEVLDCNTEDEATQTAWRRMDGLNGAKAAGVHFLAGPASQEFLRGLEGVLERALAHLLDYSCSYTKLIHTESPTAKELAKEMKQTSARQREEALSTLREQAGKEVDRENTLRALKYTESQEPFEWRPSTAIMVDNSIITFPRVRAAELGNTRLAGERRLKVARGGANRKSAYDWTDDKKRTEFCALVEKIWNVWRQALVRFSSEEGLTKHGTHWQGVSIDLLKQAIRERRKYTGSDRPIPVRLRPKAFALRQAARELNILNDGSDYSFEKLDPYYRRKTSTPK